jgi:predicted ribosomally synthesized peptide with SipW-like signal peptide
MQQRPRRATRGTHAGPRRHVLDTVRLRAFLALGVIGALAATGSTFASWTDSVAIAGTDFSTGTIDLKVQNLDAVPAYTDLTITTMVPGNTVAGVLTVKNSGTAPLKYTATTTASNTDGKALATALVVKVTGAATITGTAPSATCGGSTLTGTGTAFGGGLVTTGRLLAAGASETLCVQVTLPTTAASSLQGATTSVAFTFTSTSDLA